MCVSRKNKKCSIVEKRISKYQRKRLINGLNQIKTTHPRYSEAFLSVKHAALFSRNVKPFGKSAWTNKMIFFGQFSILAHKHSLNFMNHGISSI